MLLGNSPDLFGLLPGHDPPKTREDWEQSLNFSNHEQLTDGTFRRCFGVDLGSVLADIATQMSGMEGIETLSDRVLGDEGRAETQFSELRQWLATKSRWRSMFSGNSGCPQELLTELQRYLLSHALKLLQAQLRKRSDSLIPPPWNSAATSNFHLVRGDSAREGLASNGFTVRNSSPQPVVERYIKHEEGLRTMRIEDALDFNLRLYDSRSNGTITRVPLRMILTGVAAGLPNHRTLDGCNFSYVTLCEFVAKNIEQDLVDLWNSMHQMLWVTETRERIEDEISFAVALNAFFVGPRHHQDMGMTINLGPKISEAAGKWVRCTYTHFQANECV